MCAGVCFLSPSLQVSGCELGNLLLHFTLSHNTQCPYCSHLFMVPSLHRPHATEVVSLVIMTFAGSLTHPSMDVIQAIQEDSIRGSPPLHCPLHNRFSVQSVVVCSSIALHTKTAVKRFKKVESRGDLFFSRNSPFFTRQKVRGQRALFFEK